MWGRLGSGSVEPSALFKSHSPDILAFLLVNVMASDAFIEGTVEMFISSFNGISFDGGHKISLPSGSVPSLFHSYDGGAVAGLGVP